MSKVSSNAGKHPYLRSDCENLFNHLIIEKKGKLISSNLNPFFNVEIKTEFYDNKMQIISYRDIIQYKKEKYQINYDSQNFSWIAINVDSNKIEKLNEIAQLSVLQKKNADLLVL